MILPRYRVSSVVDLTPELLGGLGISALLLDVDCTLKRYTEDMPSPEVLAWLRRMREAGICLCLLSNGKERRISKFAAGVGLPYIAMALKPFPCGCLRAAREFGLDRKKTAMVGDQVFADIVAGNLAGMASVLATPIHPEEEHWFTRVKRPFEKFVLLFAGGKRWIAGESNAGGGESGETVRR